MLSETLPLPQLWFDHLGGVASAACALHCLLTAAAPAALAALGIHGGETLEWGFVLVAVAFAALAGGLGFRLHRSLPIAVGFGAGACGLLAGRLGEGLGLGHGAHYIAIVSGLLLVGVHIASLRQCRRCGDLACSTG